MIKTTTSALLATTILGLGLLAAAPAHAANEFYVTIEGSKQGRFKGESPKAVHRDKLPGLAFEYGVKSPRDVATGQASGKRQHGTVTFTKEWGAATPQLFQALVSNEAIKSVLFEFVRTAPNGRDEVIHTVKLTGAAIVEIAQRTEPVTGPDARSPAVSNPVEIEKVSFTFDKIEMENRAGGTVASDDVVAR